MIALPLLLAALAADGAPRTFAVADGSTLSFRLRHPFHPVDGRSRAVEGRARWLPDGTVQVMVRARVDSFDSGNSNRDAHMKEVLEAARLPWVQLKAVAEGLSAERWSSTASRARWPSPPASGSPRPTAPRWWRSSRSASPSTASSIA